MIAVVLFAMVYPLYLIMLVVALVIGNLWVPQSRHRGLRSVRLKTDAGRAELSLGLRLTWLLAFGHCGLLSDRARADGPLATEALAGSSTREGPRRQRPLLLRARRAPSRTVGGSNDQAKQTR